VTQPVLRCSIDAAPTAAVSTELLVLGPSLGTTTAVWQPIVDEFVRTGANARLRILRWDLPGHGASPAATASFSVEELADAVVRLVDEVGGGRFHYAGISLGGVVGLELALRHPDRVLSLGLFGSGARIGTAQGWADRAAQTRTQGTASLVTGSAGRWFTQSTLARSPGPAARQLELLPQIDDESYALCVEALAAWDRTADVGAIAAPVLTVSGDADETTTTEAMATLAAGIPTALGHIEFADAGHLVPLADPARSAALIADLVSGRPSGTDIAAAGMTTRRAVLGDAHVDAATARITPETAAFQDFITRYAWGEIWTRPGLARRDRSIATLAALIGGNHHAEVAMHVRAALRNGLTRDEIAEVILHTALYAGLPASNEAFAILQRTLATIDDEETSHG
jgi:3-oxoadipate enol-lactonase / 4-carboxymuconolactone decarboxylase